MSFTPSPQPMCERRLVRWLSPGQLITWGSVFYTFALLMEPVERELLTRAQSSLAFSLALLAEGALACPVGRLIDRGHERAVTTGGSLLVGLCLLLHSAITGVAGFYAVWPGLGAGLAATLYMRCSCAPRHGRGRPAPPPAGWPSPPALASSRCWDDCCCSSSSTTSTCTWPAASFPRSSRWAWRRCSPVPATPGAAPLFVLLYGLGNGMITIVKGTAIAQHVSRDHVASLNGALGLPSALAPALAPLLLGVLWSAQAGYAWGLGLLLAVSIMSALALMLAQRKAQAPT